MPVKVFLSFVEEDLHIVDMFREQAKSEGYDLEFSDYAVKEPFDGENAQYTRLDITELIKEVSVTLVLIGRTTYASKWVDWETKTSKGMDKGLLGIRLHEASDHIIPRALKDYKAEIIDWDIKKVMEAIERAAGRESY